MNPRSMRWVIGGVLVAVAASVVAASVVVEVIRRARRHDEAYEELTAGQAVNRRSTDSSEPAQH